MAQPVENPIPITHCSQLHDNPSLGLPLQVGSSCESCGATQLDNCEGHFGFIKLLEPIYHPSHIAKLGKILNLVCLSLKKPKVRACQPQTRTLPATVQIQHICSA
jgi:DNA-directed RNA polymerase-5 subunit 1